MQKSYLPLSGKQLCLSCDHPHIVGPSQNLAEFPSTQPGPEVYLWGEVTG